MTDLPEKRFKPIGDPPNVVFIIYFCISLIIYNFTGPRYYDPYSFFRFIVQYIGFSFIPILFITIYNLKRGKSIFGMISIIVSILFMLIVIVGSYGQMVAEQ